MKQLCGIFDLNDKRYHDHSDRITQYSDDDYEVGICGKIRSNGGKINGELLWKIYQEHGDAITEQIHGNYILLIYDRRKKELWVFQDRTTSPLTLYYTLRDNKVYLGTSLKWLLKESGIDRRFNERVFEEFFLNGFVYGKETLLENVYKIHAFTSLAIRANGVEEIPAKYPIHDMTKGEALDKWEKTLSDAIGECYADKDEINIPLSSGYDSNYIAHIASESGSKPINAYSIGGKHGKNELPVVKENVSAYRHIRLNTALTDESTLLNLPDIVWRLEGAVYEVGIFLQYELARMVSKSGKNCLICGECADQVMNQYYLDEQRIFIHKSKESPLHYEFSEYPYIFGSYLILKKNGILSNSFGIETEYPFLDDEFVSVAHALRNINKKDKRIHVAICQERLPDTVVNNISKIGGATDVHSLFGSKEELERFVSGIEKSAFYQKYAYAFKRVSHTEKQRQTGIRKVKTTVRNMLMDILHLQVEARRQSAYYFEEMKLREYLCCAYLMIFEKLFISGKYDDQLDCVAISIGINDLMQT